jgi:hypothetical protein
MFWFLGRSINRILVSGPPSSDHSCDLTGVDVGHLFLCHFFRKIGKVDQDADTVPGDLCGNQAGIFRSGDCNMGFAGLEPFPPALE